MILQATVFGGGQRSLESTARDLVRMPRYWTLNGRFLGQPITGVQRYAREVLLALDWQIGESAPWTRDLVLEVVVPRKTDVDVQLRHTRVIETRLPGGYAWEQFVLPIYAKGGLLSLGNVGPLAVRRQILCIHDTNVRDAPDSYGWRYRATQLLFQAALTRVASQIATVSHHSAQRLQFHGLCALDRLAVIPNGHEHALRVAARHSPQTREVAGPSTIVLIGTPAPHKNVRMILDLAPRLAAAGLKLAVVGQADPRVFRTMFVEGENSGCCWLGRISDAEMRALLEDSLCLAFPSRAEGFGLPPLEAMAVGCPVVVSDCASLPEVCADAALYAAPDDAEAWFTCFLKLSQDAALRRVMAGRGRVRAGHYTWLRSAQLYLRAMAVLDGVSLSGPVKGDVVAPEPHTV